MRRTAATVPRRIAVTLGAAALVLAACAPTLPDAGPGPPGAVIAFETAYVGASSEYASGNWDASARLYREAIAAAARDERLAGWHDLAAYNLACVEARAGRRADAATAFAASIARGFRTPMRTTDGVAWTAARSALTLEHIVADPDLDAIRDEPAYREALHPYLDADDFDPAAAAVIVVSSTESDPKSAVGPPIAPGGGGASSPERRWILGDGDLRWGVARVRQAVERLVRDMPQRRFELTAADEDTSRVVWAVVLEIPEHVAGLKLSGMTTPRAAWADALADVPRRRNGLPPWSVTVGPDDDVLADALAAIGVVAIRSAR